MENGTYRYDLEMNTPLGRRRGNLELMVLGDFLNGTLTMFTRTIPIKSGHRSGHQISFAGSMKTLMRELSYQAQGTVCSSGVDLMIETDQGRYPVTGILTGARRVYHNGRA